jgi:hypothetical protein
MFSITEDGSGCEFDAVNYRYETNELRRNRNTRQWKKFRYLRAEKEPKELVPRQIVQRVLGDYVLQPVMDRGIEICPSKNAAGKTRFF